MAMAVADGGCVVVAADDAPDTAEVPAVACGSKSGVSCMYSSRSAFPEESACSLRSLLFSPSTHPRTGKERGRERESIISSDATTVISTLRKTNIDVIYTADSRSDRPEKDPNLMRDVVHTDVSGSALLRSEPSKKSLST